MGTVLEFEAYEDRRLRGQVQEIVIGRMFTRTYNVPTNAISLIPSKGDIMPGYGTVGHEEDETETNAVLKPRVKNVQYGKNPKSGDKTVIVTYYKPDVFA